MTATESSSRDPARGTMTITDVLFIDFVELTKVTEARFKMALYNCLDRRAV